MSTYQTINPRTGAVIAEYTMMTDAEVAAALDRADNAYGKWASGTSEQRAVVLTRIAQGHRDRRAELAEAMSIEMGKPIAQAEGEVELSAPSSTTTQPKARGCLPTNTSTSPTAVGRFCVPLR